MEGPARVDLKVPNDAAQVQRYIDAYRKQAKQLWSASVHNKVPSSPWPNSDEIEARLLKKGLQKPEGAQTFVQRYSHVRDLYMTYGATSRVAAIGEVIMYVLLRNVKHTAAAGAIVAFGAQQVYKDTKSKKKQG